jgi:hypothetical protein
MALLDQLTNVVWDHPQVCAERSSFHLRAREREEFIEALKEELVAIILDEPNLLINQKKETDKSLSQKREAIIQAWEQDRDSKLEGLDTSRDRPKINQIRSAFVQDVLNLNPVALFEEIPPILVVRIVYMIKRIYYAMQRREIVIMTLQGLFESEKERYYDQLSDKLRRWGECRREGLPFENRPSVPLITEEGEDYFSLLSQEFGGW